MFYLLQMTIIESANLYLFIKKLQAENVFVPAIIIDNLALLNQHLVDDSKLKGVAIRHARQEIQKIYQMLFGFFSSDMMSKKYELKLRGRGDLSQKIDEKAVFSIYPTFMEKSAAAEQHASKLSMFGVSNAKMLDNYQKTTSNVFEKLYEVISNKQALCQASESWNVSEVRDYLNNSDAEFLSELIKVFHHLAIDEDTVSDFAESYDGVVQSTEVRKKQSGFASLYEKMMENLVGTLGANLEKMQKDVLILLSDLLHAKDRFNDLDKEAMLNFPREDFGRTMLTEIKEMLSSLKVVFQHIKFILSSDFVTNLTIIQKQANEKLISLTLLNQASVMPIFDEYRSYQQRILNLFKDVFFSEKIYFEMSKKTATFLELLSPIQRVSMVVNGKGVENCSTVKNADCSEPVRVKSPALMLSNHFFLGSVRPDDSVEKKSLLPSVGVSKN